ncbi:MAG: RdgB/HAM1 family non-canonical purine NTP pyrophosphatase [Chitinophagales bacterium]|nr:RdgB/HAM1 family non-canonical purine NTP pyrophosphatase [Chitinophagales bacterium]
MKLKLIFATSNEKKLKEVKEILGVRYEVLSLRDIQFEGEIPEPFDTIKQNSIFKANFFFEKTKLPCIAEDSGLEVEFLGGRPSAYSARYAGEERDDTKNYEKVLAELGDSPQRNARFISIITLKDTDCEEVFEGHMEGSISHEPRGKNGFGYDPIFIPQGFDKTNAELTSEEKNAISHRRKAIDKLTIYFLS